MVNSQNVREHILLSGQELSQEELLECKQQMKQLLLPPIMREENQKLLAELEEYYGQNVGVRS